MTAQDGSEEFGEAVHDLTEELNKALHMLLLDRLKSVDEPIAAAVCDKLSDEFRFWL